MTAISTTMAPPIFDMQNSVVTINSKLAQDNMNKFSLAFDLQQHFTRLFNATVTVTTAAAC
jgi:hypothetical protein